MYFGSVRFFKDLIRSIIIVVIASLVIALGIFIFLFVRQKELTLQVTNDYKELSGNLNLPDEISFKEIFAELKKKGITEQEIIDTVSENDPQILNVIYDKHFVSSGDDTANEYTKLFPDLNVTPPTQFNRADKTVYLTFDDGPNENTEMVLSILDKYNIKATFFSSGSTTDEGKRILKEIVDKGHTVGIHSNSHSYNTIYLSVENLLEDMDSTSKIIEDATGVKPNIYRFPGGSINNYNRSNYMQLIAEVTRRGYVYYDWDLSAQDASTNANWTSIYHNVINDVDKKNSPIILMHDTKYKTVTALEDIIQALQNKGYSFDKLTNEVKPSTFAYLD